MSCCTPLRRCRLACARGVNRTSDGIAASCSPLSSAHWIPRRLRAPVLGADHTLRRGDEIDRDVIRTAPGFGAPGGRSSRIRPPSARMTARSMTCCSSLTLPGQSYVVSASISWGASWMSGRLSLMQDGRREARRELYWLLYRPWAVVSGPLRRGAPRGMRCFRLFLSRVPRRGRRNNVTRQ